MSPYHRNALLDAGFALEHLVWSYRAELDRTPSTLMTADDICAHDFATRTAALVRSLLDGDNETQRGQRLAFRPPSVDAERRLAAALQARRHARAEAARKQANAPSGAPPPAPPPDPVRAEVAAAVDAPARETNDLEPMTAAAADEVGTGATRVFARRRPR
jgi:hypothetical protein